MDKRKATELSRSGKYSIGELRKMIAVARTRGGMSRVNPQFAIADTCDIFERALAGRDDGEMPSGMRYDAYKNREVPGRDSLMIANILRDCA